MHLNQIFLKLFQISMKDEVEVDIPTDLKKFEKDLIKMHNINI
jgi:hypothetical protein